MIIANNHELLNQKFVKSVAQAIVHTGFVLIDNKLKVETP